MAEPADPRSEGTIIPPTSVQEAGARMMLGLEIKIGVTTDPKTPVRLIIESGGRRVHDERYTNLADLMDAAKDATLSYLVLDDVVRAWRKADPNLVDDDGEEVYLDDHDDSNGD